MDSSQNEQEEEKKETETNETKNEENFTLKNRTLQKRTLFSKIENIIYPITKKCINKFKYKIRIST